MLRQLILTYVITLGSAWTLMNAPYIHHNSMLVYMRYLACAWKSSELVLRGKAKEIQQQTFLDRDRFLIAT
jgi:hypothetical protein